MPCWIILLRGIDVGGKNLVAMKDLRPALESAGFEDVATYIQSGNVLGRHDIATAKDVASRVAEVIEAIAGFRPVVFALTQSQLAAAVLANPYSDEGADEPKTVHFGFVDGAPGPGALAKLSALAASTESFELVGNMIYLHAPQGVARSKLAGGMERAIGLGVTSRNLRTVQKVLALATE